MKTQKPNILTDAQHTFAKRWIIAVSALYGLVLVGVLAAIVVTSSAFHDDSAGASQRMALNELDEFTVPGTSPGQSAQVRSSGTEATDGVGNAQAPIQATRAAVVPIPEVDEMGEDIHLSSGNGSGPSPQARAALAAQSADVLVENGWDFNDPDSIPGFGSMPQPGASPSPDELRRTARTNR